MGEEERHPILEAMVRSKASFEYALLPMAHLRALRRLDRLGNVPGDRHRCATKAKISVLPRGRGMGEIARNQNKA